MKVIGLVGRIGAGKDEVSKHLEEEHGFEAFGMGDVIRNIAKERGVEPTRENLQRIGKECREERGDDFLARKAAEEMKSSDNQNFVLNGLRNPEEFEAVKDEFGSDFTLLHLDACEEIRFERLKERNDSRDPDTLEELRKQDKRGVEKFNLDETIEMADQRIENHKNDLSELHRKLKNHPAIVK